MTNKYKVSDNVISITKYFKYKNFYPNDFYEFINGKVPAEISGLVTNDEVNHKKIDNKLLNDLEDVIDELNSFSSDDIDFEYINQRLLQNS